MTTVPLRRRLFQLVAAALLPVIIASGIALYSLYRQHTQQAERSVLEVARALSTAVDAELSRTVSVLEALATSASLERGELAQFAERVQRIQMGQRNWRTVILLDTDGRQILNTTVPGGRLPGVVERRSYERVLRERVPVVGVLTKGPNGQWGVPVRVPVIQGGKTRFVLTAVLKPEGVLDVLNRTRVPGDWVIAIADADGVRVARTQSFEQTVGTPFSPTLVEMMARGGGEGTGVTTNSEG